MPVNTIDIPDSIDTLLDHWNSEGPEQMRATLLHKHNDRTHIMLTEDLQTFEALNGNAVATSVSPNDLGAQIFQDACVQKRQTKQGWYGVVQSSHQQKTLLPYEFTRELPSLILPKKLENNCYELFSLAGDLRRTRYRLIAEKGYLPGLKSLVTDQAYAQLFARRLALARSMHAELGGLFAGEKSPSLALDDALIAPEDKLLLPHKPSLLHTIASDVRTALVPTEQYVDRFFGLRVRKPAKDEHVPAEEQFDVLDEMGGLTPEEYLGARISCANEKTSINIRAHAVLMLAGNLAAIATLQLENRAVLLTCLGIPLCSWMVGGINYVRSHGTNSDGFIATARGLFYKRKE